MVDRGLTRGRVLVDDVLGGTVTIVVVDRGDGTVDGELLEVGPAVTAELSIEVREDTSLQQRVFGEVDTADNVAGLEL